jgi:hypothetical protein
MWFMLFGSGDLYFCHRSDRGQSFTSKAQSAYRMQVCLTRDLTRCMPHNRQLKVCLGHSHTVIDNVNGAQAPFLDNDGYTGCSSVNGIFYKLLDHRFWTLNNFSRGDLIGKVLG